MTNPTKGPPHRFSEAEVLFGRFLASNGYPARVYWIREEELVIGLDHSRLVRRTSLSGGATFEQRYLQGVAKGFGIGMSAHCASQDHTFATIYIPEDAIDAQYHLMGPGLKMSCPITLVSGAFECPDRPSFTRWWRRYKSSLT